MDFNQFRWIFLANVGEIDTEEGKRPGGLPGRAAAEAGEGGGDTAVAIGWPLRPAIPCEESARRVRPLWRRGFPYISIHVLQFPLSQRVSKLISFDFHSNLSSKALSSKADLKGFKGAPCCSPSGWCGGSPDFCDCPGCRRFLKLEERKNAATTALRPSIRLKKSN